MPGCSVVGCTNSCQKGFRLFRLPSGEKNKQRLKLWINRIARKYWIPSKHSRICEVHFTDDQFENNRSDKRRLLKQDAVPSLFGHKIIHKKKQPKQFSKKRKSFSAEQDSEINSSQVCIDAIKVEVSSDIEETNDLNKRESLSTEQNLEVNSSQICSDIVKVEVSSDTEKNNDFNNRESLSAKQDLEINSFDARKVETSFITKDINGNPPQPCVVPPLVTMAWIQPCYMLGKFEDNRSIITTSNLVNLEQVKKPPLDGFKNDKIDALKRKVGMLQRKIRELEQFKNKINVLFSEDQLHCILKSNVKHSTTVWSDATIRRSLKIKSACGSKGYDYLRKIGFPLPCEQTLQRKIPDLVTKPTILLETPAISTLKVEEICPHKTSKKLELKLDEIFSDKKQHELLIEEMIIPDKSNSDFDSSSGV